MDRRILDIKLKAKKARPLPAGGPNQVLVLVRNKGEIQPIVTARGGTADQRRIASALEQLGWKRQKQSWDGKRWWTKG